MLRSTLFFVLLGGGCADVYMQYPPGSNNRLQEGGGNRNNNNRLMDTQNNAKGGYGYGGTNTNKAPPVKYMAGSQLSVAWTSQHSCGSENTECQIVIQYMCSGDENAPPEGVPVNPQATPVGEGPIRDGTNGGTPDPNNADGDKGLHEPASFYQACDARERNKGLYNADQNLNNNDARRTRQNPNGARSGLECPEERDYYPYWSPSPWKDVAIMTNNVDLCPWYREQSQNRMRKGYCSNSQSNNAVPNNEAACNAETGAVWKWVDPFDIEVPECFAAPFQRDNHLGNGPTGHEVFFNWTIPYGAGPKVANTATRTNDAKNCVLRLRYNITTADTRACSVNSETIATKEDCTAAGGIWSAAFVTASHNDKTLNSQVPLPPQNPKVNMGGFLSGTGGTDSLLELAINTNQYGRTFQDRSHVFSIEGRPANVAENVNIYNLNVKGKRGNIVQTYPATEYDFHPVDLVVGQQDLVHFQWTGNDNTNNNGNNNGEGTNNEDRHNIVQLDDLGLDVPKVRGTSPPQSGDGRRLEEDGRQLQTGTGVPTAAPTAGGGSSPGGGGGSSVVKDMFDVVWEWNPDERAQFAGSRSADELAKQFALVKQTGCLASGNINNDQQNNNCEKLNAAEATVDLGLLQMKPGTYKYMSSRNNNFSNRAQKASITILNAQTAPAPEATSVNATVLPSSNANEGWMRVQWSAPGQPTVSTRGEWVWNVAQEQKEAKSYSLSMSIDGGTTWTWPEGCQRLANFERSCDVGGIPAGTTSMFRVHSGNAGGWSAGSIPAIAETPDSATSAQCKQQLRDELEGRYLSPGAIVAIVIGVIAALMLAAFAMFMVRRRTPPPPPPPMKASEQPAYA